MRAMTNPEDLAAVRRLFERERDGVLCSSSAAAAGWPYGSVVPYALLDDGDTCVFLSDIAEHTRNLQRDPRATLLVRDATADDPQAAPRHAMMVRARCPDGEERERLEDAYFARFPGAERMRQAHGFRVWRLECERVRWIAGFGSMGWITRADWTGQPDPLAGAAAGIVSHLNDDHADALLELAVAGGAAHAKQAQAVAVDRGGLDLLVGSGDDRKPLRVPFDRPAATGAEVRQAVIAMLRRIRAQQAAPGDGPRADA